MSTYRIVCTEQSDPTAQGHGHIIAVGLGDEPGRATERVPVADVRRRLDSGDVFYTSDDRGNVALVEKFDCWCDLKTIRSAPDATTANNLDSLRLCNWK